MEASGCRGPPAHPIRQAALWTLAWPWYRLFQGQFYFRLAPPAAKEGCFGTKLPYWAE